MRTSIILALLLALCTGTAIAAEEQPDTITVEATGIGMDSDAAHKNALKSAVQQALGSLIDTKVMIENDEVIEDKILSHSGGFVESNKIIEGPTTVDGMVTVKIRAQVKRTQLLSSLQTERVIVQKVDGLSLGGESFTKSESQSSSLSVATEMLKGYPAEYTFFESLGSPSIDGSGKKVMLKARAGMDWDKCQALFGKLEALFEQAAVVAPRRHRISAGFITSTGGYPILQMSDFDMGEQTTQNSIFILSRISEDRTLLQWREYTVSSELFDTILDKTDRPYMVVDLLDAAGAVIDTQRMRLPRASVYYPELRTLFFIPFLVEHGTPNTVLGPTAPVTYTFTFDKLFPDEIEEIEEVKIYLQ